MDEQTPSANLDGEQSKGQPAEAGKRPGRENGEFTKKSVEMARKALKVIRARDPQTIDDLPVKNYSPEELYQMVTMHCAALAEHVDTVQIFITTYDGQKTSVMSHGTGNHLARICQVEDWLATREPCMYFKGEGDPSPEEDGQES